MDKQNNLTNFSKKDIEIIKLFNSMSDEIINSTLVRESKEKKSGIKLSWNMNKDTNELQFSYSKSDHSKDAIKSFILTLRLFIQDNEPISIRNMRELYQRLPIDKSYKNALDILRDEFNKFLDEPATTLSDDKPSRRTIYNAIIYGMYAHTQSEMTNLIANWQSDKLVWDMVFYEFQSTLHDFVSIIELIRKLNERVLKDYAITR